MADDMPIATNPDTGQMARLVNGKWEVVDSPMTFTGAAKSVGSGLLHEGIPALFGLPGDAANLANKGAAWAVNKIRGSEGTDKEVKPEDIAAVAPGPAALIQKYAPTSETIKEKLSNKIAPEYTPQNFLERGLKTSAGIAPAALLAPEAGIPAAAGWMARALGGLGAGARSATRFGLAPGFASEGVKEGFDAVGAGDSKWKDPASMVAMLAGPMAATKLITPNPTNIARRAFGQTLDEAGATYTPKQLTGGDLQREADAVRFPGSGTSPKAINDVNTENYNRGVMKTAFGDTLPPGPVRDQAINAKSITPELRGQIGQTIDSEFNRLAASHNLPLTKRLEGQLDNVVKSYDKEAVLRKSPQLADDLTDIKDAFANGKTAGFIDGRQYLNLRSRLSGLANSEADTSLAKGLRGLRDALDNDMSATVAKYYPNDAGAFERARSAYQNKMVLDNAMNKAQGSAARSNITPDDLASSTRSIMPDAFDSGAHPLVKLARAGQNVLTPLPKGEPSGLRKELPLLGMLAGGPALDAALTGHSALGTTLGFGTAAATYGARPVVGRLTGTPWGRAYLANQALPAEVRGAGATRPANAAMMAEALNKPRRRGEE